MLNSLEQTGLLFTQAGQTRQLVARAYNASGQLLSVSMGTATCQAGSSLDMAAQGADHSMYEAKAAFYRDHKMERRQGEENL